MPAISVNQPFPIFTDADGQPLDDAYIYIGAANQNPVSNPITVYWDSALTIPASQPIRTSGGYATEALLGFTLTAITVFWCETKTGRLFIRQQERLILSAANS